MGNQTGWTSENSLLSEGKGWDSVSTDPLPPLEPGMYLAKVVDSEAKQSAKQKIPMVELQFDITHVFQGDALDPQRKVRDRVMIMKEAAFRIKGIADATEVTPPNTDGYEAVSQFADDLLGKELIVALKRETNRESGKVYTVVDRYLTQDKAQVLLAERAANGSAAAPEGDNGDARRGRRRGGRRS